MIDREDFAEVIVMDVTAEDIAHGRRSSCDDCPIARAAQRTFPGHKVMATHNHVYVDLLPDTDDYFIVYEGEGQSLFTKGFDQGEEMSPFTLTLTRNDIFSNLLGES